MLISKSTLASAQGRVSQGHVCNHDHSHGHDHSHDHHHHSVKDTVVTDRVARSPGVQGLPEGQRPVLTEDQAAEMVAQAAEDATKGGTYGVAGLLLGPDRELIATSVNAVFKDDKMRDPTAHGERQLVDWYFTQVEQGADLPAPEDLTIVSSLDPCVMCAGSILASGMDVSILSYDQYGGVDFKGDGEFSTLPEGIRADAQSQFSYLGIDGGRDYQGDHDGIFEGGRIALSVEQQSLKAFEDSVPMVKEFMANLDIDPAAMRNPAELLTDKGDKEILSKARAVHAETLTLKIPDPENPGPKLAKKLMEVAAKAHAEGNSYDAAALVDPHGNVLLTAGSREGTSPIQTPLFEISRTYNEMRNAVGEAGENHFPPFKYCKFVTLQGPAQDGASVAELGGFCSSVKGKFPEGSDRHWQYLLPNQPQSELDQMVDRLPPRYSQKIAPDIQQVRSQEAIEMASEGAKQAHRAQNPGQATLTF